jgi:hypothetical protein
MGKMPPQLQGHQFKSGNKSGKSSGAKSGSGGPPWDPDNDNDVDVPSKLPAGMKDTGDTDNDAPNPFKTGTATPRMVKKMVAAHSKVPDAKKPAFRSKVIAHARKAKAMQHIPSAWLSGHGGAPSDVKKG